MAHFSAQIVQRFITTQNLKTSQSSFFFRPTTADSFHILTNHSLSRTYSESVSETLRQTTRIPAYRIIVRILC